MLCLVARHRNTVLRFPLPDGTARLGSAPGNDIVLPFPGVSREHALVVRSGGGTEIFDLGSRNGVRLGRERTRKARLDRDIVVRLGSATIAVEESDPADFDVALSTHDDRAAHPFEAPAAPSTSGLGEDEAVAAAFRFVRRTERRGRLFPAAQKQAFLAEAGALLGATTLAVAEAGGEGTSLSIVALEGPLPPADLMGAAERMLARPRRMDRVERVVLGPIVALVSRPDRGEATLLLAVFAPGASALRAWQLDLFDYVSQRLAPVDRPGQGSPLPEKASPGPAGGPLRIPPSMIVGRSEPMERLLEQIRATVRSRLDVLLLGETGVGKEFFARMIHGSGPDAEGPFVAINCAAIPPDLLEAELFGVTPRSATGVDARPGYFLLAHGGTVFLDEVGELAEPLQAKILRVLQEREVLSVGASTPRKVAVRVISASNRNLAAEVEKGRFRADLFFRLRGLQFLIPPLRERREDIPPLVLGFVERAALEYGKAIRGVSRKALDLLLRHEWPGNVRELEAEVRRAVLLCQDGGILRSEDLGDLTSAPLPDAGERDWRLGTPGGEAHPSRVGLCPDPPAAIPTVGLRERLAHTERQAIDEALAVTGGNKSLAAKLLGITRNGLAMKLARRERRGTTR